MKKFLSLPPNLVKCFQELEQLESFGSGIEKHNSLLFRLKP